MDTAILHDRLAANEKAVIEMDERLDALSSTEDGDARDARIASLEGALTECLSRLQAMEAQALEATARIVEAQAQEAESEAQEAEAEADAAEAIVEALDTEPEVTEPEVTEEITELEPEPESESEAGPENSKSPSWWENLFALR